MRRPRDGDDENGGSARWRRREVRREAERRRIPKHGKSYVKLAQQMIARRAAAAAEGTSADTERPGRKRRPSRARRPTD
jgi:hypothetical protein